MGVNGKKKKNKRSKYKVLDLSAGDKKKEEAVIDETENKDETSGQPTADPENCTEEFELDIDDLEENDERFVEKRSKEQEYNLFVKTHRNRGPCTTKRSKRPRNDST